MEPSITQPLQLRKVGDAVNRAQGARGFPGLEDHEVHLPPLDGGALAVALLVLKTDFMHEGLLAARVDHVEHGLGKLEIQAAEERSAVGKGLVSRPWGPLPQEST